MEYDYTYEVIEKILLKKSLKDKKYLSIMAEVFDSRWFDKNKNNAILMLLATKYYSKYGNIPDNTTMKGMIQSYCEKHQNININDLNAALITINSFDIDVNSECSLKNIEKYINEKGFYFTVSDNVQDILKSGNVDRCLKRFERIQKISFADDDLGMDYFSKEAMDKHWNYINNPEAKLSTGWRSLDDVTHGGFLVDGRMLALFVGQAGLGKSLFLANIALNFVSQDKSVVVISLEMSQDVYAQRFDSVIANTNINTLKRTGDITRNRIENFYKIHPNANLVIKEYAPKSVRVVDIEAYLEKLIENGKRIDAIIIDYLNLLLPNTKSDNMYQSVLAVAEQLRGLSYKFNAPVISATQTNRSGMNNDSVDIQNISESNGPAFTADFIGMLYSTLDGKDRGEINMRIAKNRFGAPGKILNFKVNRETLKLEDETYSNESKSEADLITESLANISSDMELD